MPLLALSLSFVLGILLGAALRLPALAWGLLAALFAGLAWLERSRPAALRLPAALRRLTTLPLALLLAFACLGALRWQSARPAFDPGDLAFYNDSGPALITAHVSADPDRRTQADLLILSAESIRLENGTTLPVRGRLLVRLTPGSGWQYGDRLELTGEPAAPPEGQDFSYRAYLARQGIYTYLLHPRIEKINEGAGSAVLAALYRLRASAQAVILRIFPQPEAALLAGILLGLDQGLPQSLELAFQQTGTAHIIAISGFNMAVLAGLFIGLFGRILPRGWAALAAAAAIGFYTLLVGANPAVVRAALMSVLALGGRLLGRRSSGLTPLAFSAGLLCLFNPELLWDVSFQLSFTATLGLVLYAEPLQRRFEDWAGRKLSAGLVRRLSGPVSEYLLFTLAAQLVTLPVILAHFQRASLSALIANPLILPVQPLVMMLGGAAVLAGLVWVGFGQVLGALAWPLAAYTVRAVELLARIPGGSFSVGALPPWSVWLIYALLFGLTLGGAKAAQIRRKVRPAFLLGGLGLVTALAWNAALLRPDGRLHLTFFPLMESRAALLVTPGGNSVLIGTAADANELSGALGRSLGPLRGLDALVVDDTTPAGLDGLAGTLERLRLKQALWAVAPPDSRAGQRLRDILASGPAAEALLSASQTVALDKALTLTVLDASREMAALRLEFGGLCVLWPGPLAPENVLRIAPDAPGCFLVLNESHLQNRPPADWSALQPAGVILTGSPPGTELPAGWSAAHPQGLQLVSDGQQIWIE